MLPNETIEDLNIESSRNKFEYLSRSPNAITFKVKKHDFISFSSPLNVVLLRWA